MSKRDPLILLQDMLTAMERILKYCDNMDKETFLHDDKTVDASVRNIEIIGEAAARMPTDYTSQYPKIPWQKMAGMRNRIVHDYFGIDLEIIWQVISHNIPELKQQIEKLRN